MKNIKYACLKCAEEFEIRNSSQQEPITCPRCGTVNVKLNESCSLEIGPPAWEFLCQDCKSRFAVQSPRGPEEVVGLSCPVCRSQRIKWLALSTAACGTGG